MYRRDLCSHLLRVVGFVLALELASTRPAVADVGAAGKEPGEFVKDHPDRARGTRGESARAPEIKASPRGRTIDTTHVGNPNPSTRDRPAPPKTGENPGRTHATPARDPTMPNLNFPKAEKKSDGPAKTAPGTTMVKP